MNNGDRRFGATVRRRRQEQKIGLRQFAKMLGVSPTYLSKVERDEFDPPAEDKVIAIADILGFDRDELLALAGRVSSDLIDIIKRKPRQMATFLRTANGLTPQEIERFMEEARKARKKR